MLTSLCALAWLSLTASAVLLKLPAAKPPLTAIATLQLLLSAELLLMAIARDVLSLPRCVSSPRSTFTSPLIATQTSPALPALVLTELSMARRGGALAGMGGSRDSWVSS